MELDLSVETGGGTLTLSRRYADANRVVLALGMSTRTSCPGASFVTLRPGPTCRSVGSGYVEPSGESVYLHSWLAPEPLPPGEIEPRCTRPRIRASPPAIDADGDGQPDRGDDA